MTNDLKGLITMANISRRNFIASAGLLLAGTLVGCGSNGSSTGSAWNYDDEVTYPLA